MRQFQRHFGRHSILLEGYYGRSFSFPGFGRILAEKLVDSLTSPLPKAISRRLFLSATFPGKASAVIGIRRAGKATLLHQVRRERLEAGQPQDGLPYVNFEDERLGSLALEHLTALLDEYYRRYPAYRASRRSPVPGRREIDFLARSAEGKQELILVCADPGDAGTLDRELRALAEAGRAYPTAARRLLTLTGTPVPDEVPSKVIIQPAYEWLLSPP